MIKAQSDDVARELGDSNTQERHPESAVKVSKGVAMPPRLNPRRLLLTNLLFPRMKITTPKSGTSVSRCTTASTRQDIEVPLCIN